jgi:hypothetical protein
MSYILLRGRCCDITILNVHTPTEDKIDDMKDSFYEELGCVLDKFQKYRMKMLRYFNSKVGTEDIFKQQLGMRVYTKAVMIMELE